MYIVTIIDRKILHMYMSCIYCYHGNMHTVNLQERSESLLSSQNEIMWNTEENWNVNQLPVLLPSINICILTAMIDVCMNAYDVRVGHGRCGHEYLKHSTVITYSKHTHFKTVLGKQVCCKLEYIATYSSCCNCYNLCFTVSYL